jgi:hypothetical protein
MNKANIFQIFFLVVFYLSSSLWAQSRDENPFAEFDGVPTLGEEKSSVDNLNEKIEAEYKNLGEFSPQEKQKSEGLTEEESRQISRFFEEASKNYEDILNNRPDAEVKTSNQRINSNKELLQENSAKLNHSEGSLRKLKLEYIRRFLIIKKAYENKSFSKETYEKELEKLAKQYEYRVRTMTEDVNFYKGEVNKTDDRLKSLEELNRINKIMYRHHHQEDPEKPKKSATELEKMVDRLQSVGVFEVKDVWKAPDVK